MKAFSKKRFACHEEAQMLLASINKLLHKRGDLADE